MVHFHLGSQVANVQDVARGMREAARYYVELRKLGAPVDTVDVGGGLGVDYEGTRSRSYCSMNYSVREYARNIIRTLAEVCETAGEPQPNLISESGRALTAHHAVLITSVVDSEVAPSGALEAPHPDAPAALRSLHELPGHIDADGPIECLHDAANYLADAQTQYTLGLIPLRDRAYAERAYYAVARAVLPKLDPTIRAERDALDELREKLSAKYFCNFSVFQSVPDAWAIEQVFPIVPIHRLDERPELRGRLCDLTCDSDGRLDLYVDREGVMSTMALHELQAPKSLTCWRSSWSAPTRKFSATCTTCSATPTPSMWWSMPMARAGHWKAPNTATAPTSCCATSIWRRKNWLRAIAASSRRPACRRLSGARCWPNSKRA